MSHRLNCTAAQLMYLIQESGGEFDISLTSSKSIFFCWVDSAGNLIICVEITHQIAGENRLVYCIVQRGSKEKTKLFKQLKRRGIK